MNKTIFVGAVLAGLLFVGYAITFQSTTVRAGEPKNLKVYPKGTSKKAIKKDMKIISKALGVKCEHCHEKSAMEKDTKNKLKARKMMIMTNTINKSLKKDGFEAMITCKTCHRGEEEPAK